MKSSIPYNGYTNDNRSKKLDAVKQKQYTPDVPKFTRSYERSNGVYASPLADPDSDGVVIFRLHNKFGYATVEFEASKIGGPPIIPAPMDSFSSGDVLQDATINTVKPEADNQGNVVWAMAGSYTYIQKDVRDENSHYEIGIAPYGEQRNFASSLTGGIVPGRSVSPARQGTIGIVSGALQGQGFIGEYPQAFFIDDAFVPIVNFDQPDYTYTLPIFSNQFFSQAMVI